MHFAGRMNDEGARRDRDGCGGRAHRAAAGKAEVDFGGLRMAMVWADLSRLPARHGDVAVGDLAQDLLDMVLGVPLLLGSRLKTCMTIALREDRIAA